MSDEHEAEGESDDRRVEPSPSGSDVPRETVSVPNQVDLPRLLDFYDLQDASHTGIYEFYENLGAGRLTTTRCTDCDTVHFPPRIVCPDCMGEDLEYTALPHEGTLYSFTEVRGEPPTGMGETPFVVGVVDLGEVRLSARIDGTRHAELEIGDPVRLKIVDIDGPADHDRVFYRFVPTATR